MEKFIEGIENYLKRIKKCENLYLDLINSIPKTYDEKIYRLQDKGLFYEILLNFVTGLDNEKATGDLAEIYDVSVHMKTKALIIANKGATLFSLTEKHEVPNIIRHIGMCVYMPHLGMEYVNVGISGNIYDNDIVLRTESACTPSFLFGSQRCNCHYQWKNVRELAGYFNPIVTPDIDDGDEFEEWVQKQFKYENGRHIYQGKSNAGIIMLHVDSQNGMGSGYTENEFVFDLAERASLRHRGEYTAEQTYKTTMYGGFTTIGINGDPRGENNGVGYQITPVVLDYLDANKRVIMLTNNPLKIGKMKEFGYEIIRVKSIGAVNVAGATEAKQRGSEFHHMDICENHISFSEDYERMKMEIGELLEQETYAKL